MRDNPSGTDFLELEEEQLVVSAKSGNADALAALVMRYIPRIQAKASRYVVIGLERDDLTQEGLIGLFKAVQGFDHAVGTPVGAYINLCVNHAIFTAVKRALKKGNLPLANYLPLDSLAEQNNRQAFETSLALDPSQIMIAREERKRIRSEAMVLLSSFEQDAFKLYLSGLSYQEIAHSLHSTSKAVDNALQRVRRKLKAVTKS